MADCISKPRSRARVFAGALLAAGLCLGASNSTPANTVTAVRFWSLGDVTRIAVEVSGNFQYRWDRLENPDRLFFDIRDAKPEMVHKGIYAIPVNDARLKQIRVAETHPGVTRVVLDLEGYAEFTASQLSSPDRLMVELRLKDRPAPAAPGFTGVRTSEPDLAANASIPTVLAPAKPEPRKFEPPPVRAEPVRAEVKTVLLLPPLMAIMSKPPRVPGPSLALKRDLPPPPDLKAELPDKAPASTAQPLPAKRNANGGQSLTRVLGLKLGRVALDPGHGGHDAGTHGPSGLYEKDVVLDVARRLGSLLEERLGSEIIYTRSDDAFIPLEERTKIANDAKADLFLSIHANSSPARYVAGAETYYLNFTTSRAALEVAARENASSERSIYDLKDLLQKIALRDKIDESREFAARLQTALYSASSKGNSTAPNRGVKKAPFVVLIGASMPSVLAEIGFLTNSGDEVLLRKPEQRQKIAEALYKGIAGYADTLSHFQVAKRD
jgi:N-acetylmuramoyl-L-alanine amidase